MQNCDESDKKPSVDGYILKALTIAGVRFKSPETDRENQLLESHTACKIVSTSYHQASSMSISLLQKLLQLCFFYI